MKYWRWFLILFLVISVYLLMKIVEPAQLPQPVVEENHLTVLCYHHVDQKKGVPYTVSSNIFIKQLDHLAEAGYVFVSLAQIEAFCYQGKKLPAKAAAITFDDGNRTVYTVAYPILRAKKIPFTVFIYPSAIDSGKRRGFMTWRETRKLASDPLVTIGSHSYWHPFLTDYYKQKSPEQWLDKQIAGSKSKIEEKLGLPVNYFAIPYGLWDQVVYDQLKAAGYRLVFNVNGNNNGSKIDPLNIDRVMVFSYDTMSSFKEKVNIKALPIIKETPKNLAVVTDNVQALSFSVRDVSVNMEERSVTLYEYHAGKLKPLLIIENMYKKNIVLNKKGFYLIKVKAQDLAGEQYCGSWSFFKR